MSSMTRFKNTLLGTALMLLLPALSQATDNPPAGLTAADARALVLELMHESRSDTLRGFSLQEEQDTSEFAPDFYWFTAMWAGPPDTYREDTVTQGTVRRGTCAYPGEA